VTPPTRTTAKQPERLAYSYLRFSTPEQLKGDSLRRQTALAAAYAQRHGLTLDTELKLSDLGVSAFRGDNVAETGALGGFLLAIKNGIVRPGSYLLVESLDRISRKQARKAVRILEDIVEAGVVVVTLNDGKEYTDESLEGTDFLIAIIILMRAHEESATKAKRLAAAWVGKRERAALGEIQTVHAPAWLHAEGSAAKDRKDASFALIPERAAIVRRIFDMFLDGHGKQGIAKTFNKEGIPTWGRARIKRSEGSQWHQTYIYKVLKSPAVTGRLVPHIEDRTATGTMRRRALEAIEGYYPRVIDEDTFTRAQTMLAARTQTVRASKVVSLVAGLARCPLCGSTMTRVQKGERSLPKLVCVKAIGAKGCQYHGVRVATVEEALRKEVARLVPPPADESLGDEIKGVDEALYLVGKQIAALIDQIEQAPSAALSKRLAAREAEAQKIEAKLGELKAKAANSGARVIAMRADRMRTSLEYLAVEPGTVAEANAALRECFDSITIDYRSGELVMNWRHGPPPARIIYDLQAAGFSSVQGAA
jgi:DNA invertase Pin-like site-specific DNA recombinase